MTKPKDKTPKVRKVDARLLRPGVTPPDWTPPGQRPPGILGGRSGGLTPKAFATQQAKEAANRKKDKKS